MAKKFSALREKMSKASRERPGLQKELSALPTGPSDLSRMRIFGSGAVRDGIDGKIRPEGFLHPVVLLEFSRYMDRHRIQADGGIRAPDNWQKGMTVESYMDSLLRHVLDVWLIHRRFPAWSKEIRGRTDNAAQLEALCGVLFNVQGHILEIIRQQRGAAPALGENS